MVTDGADTTFRAETLGTGFRGARDSCCRHRRRCPPRRSSHRLVTCGHDRVCRRASDHPRVDVRAVGELRAKQSFGCNSGTRAASNRKPSPCWTKRGRGTVAFEVTPAANRAGALSPPHPRRVQGRGASRTTIGRCFLQRRPRAASHVASRRPTRVGMFDFSEIFSNAMGRSILVSFFILRAAADLTAAHGPTSWRLIPFPTDELFREHLGSFDVVVFPELRLRPVRDGRRTCRASETTCSAAAPSS